MSKHKSTRGATGFAIEGFIEFLTGQKPLKYVYMKKRHNYFLMSSIIDNDKLKPMLDYFQDFYNIGIYKIDDFTSVTMGQKEN